MPLVDANALRTASGNKVPEAIFFAAPNQERCEWDFEE
jgi:hypothetical protein